MSSTPKIDISPELSDKELEVIHLFINGTSRLKAYRQIFPKFTGGDTTIYKWFKRDKVQNYLLEYDAYLSDYNTVCDKVLLDIIQSPTTKDRDKISAIKLWGDLRERIKSILVVEDKKQIDFTGVDDSTLEEFIKIIKDADK